MSGQVWGINALGGFMYSDQLSNVLRMALLPTVKFRQFCDAKDATEKGLHSGSLFNWNVYSRVTTGGGTLDENIEMPTTNFTITQSSMSITEYGNSVPYTGKLDDMSKHPVTEIIHKVLKVDAKETLDGAAWAQFNRTVKQVAPTGGNSTTSVTISNGPTAITNNIALNNAHVKAISDAMKESNVPAYTEDDYYAIGWPTTFRPFKNSLEAIHQYVETGFQLIANGEIGRYEGIRFIEQTAIAKGGAVNAAGYTFRNPVPWTNGLSDWVFFFGADTVAEAMVIPEEIRGKIPSDYGRSRGIAWYYMGGFGLVHGATVADQADARIYKWNSAN
jgi:N4-gp56 family major capsid protein